MRNLMLRNSDSQFMDLPHILLQKSCKRPSSKIGNIETMGPGQNLQLPQHTGKAYVLAPVTSSKSSTHQPPHQLKVFNSAAS